MYKKLLSCVREYKRPSLEAPFYVSLEVIMECIIPFITARLVNQIRNGCTMNELLFDGIMLIIMAFMSLTFGIIAGNSCSTASCGFAKNLRSDLFRAVQKFSFTDIDRFSSTSLITRITTDVSNVQRAYMMIIRTVIRGPLMLIFSFIMALIMGGRIAFVFLFAAPFLGAGLFMIARWAMPTFSRIFRQYDGFNNSVQENIHGVRVVKAFVREEYEKEKFSQNNESIRKTFTTAEKILALNNPLMQFCTYIVMIFILYYGTYRVITSRGLDLNIGQISSLITYGTQILGSLMRLSMVLVMITLARESAVRIVEVLDAQPTLTSPINGIRDMKDGSIIFEHVNFRYGDNIKTP
ncbi:MAG: ABC transporter ATP-binding protein, partial [Synergistaceae bacterium]|nr:ABC transporter ATP-binding protein [Synergistaceae bacterium]